MDSEFLSLYKNVLKSLKTCPSYNWSPGKNSEDEEAP
jgi:hypothetical protein